LPLVPVQSVAADEPFIGNGFPGWLRSWRRPARPSGNLGITSVYLQRIDDDEIIETVHARRAPMIAVSTSLRL
jgi:hypothetical protein